MEEKIKQHLLEINRNFYRRFARPFADTRAQPQPGFTKLIDYLRPADEHVLDVGCGEGRFGRFLQSHNRLTEYGGIDFTEELLTIARASVEGYYLVRDLSKPGCLDGLGEFDVIVCLATMQHIPTRHSRALLLAQMAENLADNGRIFLSNWQFLTSDRQRRKIVEWSEVGLSMEDVEQDDYLLSWQRDGSSFRYVAYINEKETEQLATLSGLKIVGQFRCDGREGDLNLYTVLVR